MFRVIMGHRITVLWPVFLREFAGWTKQAWSSKIKLSFHFVLSYLSPFFWRWRCFSDSRRSSWSRLNRHTAWRVTITVIFLIPCSCSAVLRASPLRRFWIFPSRIRISWRIRRFWSRWMTLCARSIRILSCAGETSWSMWGMIRRRRCWRICRPTEGKSPGQTPASMSTETSRRWSSRLILCIRTEARAAFLLSRSLRRPCRSWRAWWRMWWSRLSWS